MTDKPNQEYFAPASAALLLLLTAWGNAIAMFIVSLIILIILLTVFRSKLGMGGPFTALVVSVLVIVLAAVLLMK